MKNESTSNSPTPRLSRQEVSSTDGVEYRSPRSVAEWKKKLQVRGRGAS